MTDSTCKQLEDLLVDYADDALPDERRGQVEAHLAECPHCQELLAALRQSASLTRKTWDEAYEDAAGLKLSDVVAPDRYRFVRLCGAVAAAIILALAGLLVWRAIVLPVQRHSRPPAIHPEPLMATGPSLTPEQVRQSVDAAGASTALLASVDWLAEQPANRDIARQQYEFIARMYKGTQAAEQAKARLAALDQRSS